jgi:galactonate dehydratase
LLEFHARDIAWWNDLCEGDYPFIDKGFMTVSERPGIGVELNAKAAKALMWNDDILFD